MLPMTLMVIGATVAVAAVTPNLSLSAGVIIAPCRRPAKQLVAVVQGGRLIPTSVVSSPSAHSQCGQRPTAAGERLLRPESNGDAPLLR